MEANWSNGEQCRKVLPRRDVPTSQRLHVMTFQRRDVGSKIHKSTIKKRRDVSTSRRQHEICTSSFKAPMVRNSGHQEAYERGHEIQEQCDTDFEEVPVICTVSHFLDIRMMFLRLNIFIFSFSMF